MNLLYYGDDEWGQHVILFLKQDMSWYFIWQNREDDNQYVRWYRDTIPGYIHQLSDRLRVKRI